ncbi:MAG: decaprenyl-phosphate phosphoribosyltransferase [Ardenticatenia bacterium]|nr:decaprenyl-phosphate phosphoribosyltransferase [Ardenticatenia bacterium]MBK8539493.1 decaprenyl-phosphate phosphoribosyltransferase [Ardenticatenia bacterium]
MRPRQWTKNAFVLAALLLTGGLRDVPKTQAALLTALLFCVVSSGVYVVNDLMDVEGDRRHPVKRFRPLAAGEISPGLGWLLAAGLTVLGIGGGYLWVRPQASPYLVGNILLTYFLMQLAYTFVLKHMVIIDVMTIAGGFVLRVLAGGAAIDVKISAYLYLSTIFLATFQGFAKRRQELLSMSGDAPGHRPSLEEYSVSLLDTFLTITATATTVSYALYAVNTPYRPQNVSANLLLLTVPFVIYAVFRYLYLIHVKGLGGAPEEMLLKDRLLLLDVLGWVALLAGLIYFG